MAFHISYVSKFSTLALLLSLVPLGGIFGVIQFQWEEVVANEPEISATLQAMQNRILSGVGIIGLASSLVVLFMARHMARPIDSMRRSADECRHVMSQLVAGDLRVRMSGHYEDEFLDLKNIVNEALHSLHRTITAAANTGDEVVRATKFVREGSKSTADGAIQQSEALEQCSVSLAQMSAMTHQTSQNAAQACELANETYANAQRGDAAMAKMVAAIDRIQRSADQQARIVKTIDDIAFQTNLLAINAAVEAARVGDAGRGFAVVAEEVRALAQRSADAAQTTTEMIAETAKSTREGVAITDEIGFVLSHIQERARRTNDVVTTISIASREQAVGIRQISHVAQQLESVTQSSTANSRRSADVADGLCREVTVLHGLVSRFQLDREVRPETLITITATADTNSSRSSGRRREVPVQRPAHSVDFVPAVPTPLSTLDRAFESVDRAVAAAPQRAQPRPEDPLEFAQSAIDALLNAQSAR